MQNTRPISFGDGFDINHNDSPCLPYRRSEGTSAPCVQLRRVVSRHDRAHRVELATLSMKLHFVLHAGSPRSVSRRAQRRLRGYKSGLIAFLAGARH